MVLLFVPGWSLFCVLNVMRLKATGPVCVEKGFTFICGCAVLLLSSCFTSRPERVLCFYIILAFELYIINTGSLFDFRETHGPTSFLPNTVMSPLSLP